MHERTDWWLPQGTTNVEVRLYGIESIVNDAACPELHRHYADDARLTPRLLPPNLRDLAVHIESPLFMAHVRATSLATVQQRSCTYRTGRWR